MCLPVFANWRDYYKNMVIRCGNGVCTCAAFAYFHIHRESGQGVAVYDSKSSPTWKSWEFVAVVVDGRAGTGSGVRGFEVRRAGSTEKYL
jgi:hypothetical protein